MGSEGSVYYIIYDLVYISWFSGYIVLVGLFNELYWVDTYMSLVFRGANPPFRFIA